LVGVVVALAAGSAQDAEPAREVIRIRVDSIIHPVAAEFIADAITEADGAGAAALVIELDTPGGLLTSTREIFTAMLGARTPVVVYVSPSGAQAGSAGFFLLMAADIAAMTPGTNAGAAHPVSGGGEEIEGVLAEKVEQDAAATIPSLATRNGRNPEMAEAAVVESRSFTAEEALEQGLIELVVADLPTLLDQIDGREVIGAGEERQTLRTGGASVREITMGPFQRFLSALAHPNIAYLLMTIGGLGLYFELSNPGAIFPGVIGAICLILAFFALSVLPVNYAGIGLILLALILFVAEIKVTSYGLLTVAGVASLILGSTMLFKTVDPAIRVSMDIILSVAAVALVVVGFLAFMVVRMHRHQVTTGAEGLLHERGVARSALDPRGRVFVHGEIWNAVAEGAIAAGQPIEVVGVDGMTLRVRSGGRSAADRFEEKETGA
jgi:membrane-bound serine protease (ClpP class)